jgi:hypothetical protein
MSDIAADNGNGKVTLALLGAKLDSLLAAVDDLKGEMTECHKQISRDNDRLTRIETKFEDVDTFKRSMIGQVVALIFVAVMALIALAQNIAP